MTTDQSEVEWKIVKTIQKWVKKKEHVVIAEDNLYTQH